MFARMCLLMLLMSPSLQLIGGNFKILEIPKQDLEKDSLVAAKKGSFADVYKGYWMGAPVAIKQFHLKTLPSHLISEFDNYAKCAHPNLIRSYGICKDPGKFMMVLELMPQNMAEFYAKNKPDWKQNWEILYQIASGLEYLHSQQVAHKHLKSNNIFISINPQNDLPVVKIADYGLSKLKLESSSNGAAGGEATVRWRAPETFTREYARIKDTMEGAGRADVYAFGLLAWELATRRKPFAQSSESEVVRFLGHGKREVIDDTWPQAYKDLLNKCWAFVPGERPSFAQIKDDIIKTSGFRIDSASPPKAAWSISIRDSAQEHVIYHGPAANLNNRSFYSPTPQIAASFKTFIQ